MSQIPEIQTPEVYTPTIHQMLFNGKAIPQILREQGESTIIQSFFVITENEIFNGRKPNIFLVQPDGRISCIETFSSEDFSGSTSMPICPALYEANRAIHTLQLLSFQFQKDKSGTEIKNAKAFLTLLSQFASTSAQDALNEKALLITGTPHGAYVRLANRNELLCSVNMGYHLLHNAYSNLTMTESQIFVPDKISLLNAWEKVCLQFRRSNGREIRFQNCILFLVEKPDGSCSIFMTHSDTPFTPEVQMIQGKA